MKTIIITGTIICVICLTIFLSSVIYVITHAFIDNAKKSDAILALAEGTSQDGLPCTIERANHAIELYRRGFAPVIVFAGGKLPVDYAVEANVMRDIAL